MNPIMTSLVPIHPAVGTHLGTVIGDAVGGIVSSSMDEAMKGVWEAALWMLNTAFSVADTFSIITLDTRSGAIGLVWPTMLTVSVAIALGLFFWQLTLSALRGGKGMMRVATGPVAYGVALAMTVAAISAALTAADGLTTLIFTNGLNVTNFSAAFTHTSLGGLALNGIKEVALGMLGFFGVIPAAFAWVLEIIWRQAAILVLVATIPITAAGLLAHTTASWFWRGLRWTIAAIVVKPVLALILVIGVSSLASASGPVGLLAGVAVLWVALTAPVALFKLLAFVDPDTHAGEVFRESWSQMTSKLSGGEPAGSGGSSGSGSGGGSGADSGGMGAMESANTARFDAASGSGGGGQDTTPPPPGDSPTGSGSGSGSGSPSGSGSGRDGGGGTGSGSEGSSANSGTNSSAGDGGTGDGGESDGVPSAAPAAPGDTDPAHPSPHPRPQGGGGSSSGGSGGGAAAGAADEAIEAAVIL